MGRKKKNTAGSVPAKPGEELIGEKVEVLSRVLNGMPRGGTLAVLPANCAGIAHAIEHGLCKLVGDDETPEQEPASNAPARDEPDELDLLMLED